MTSLLELIPLLEPIRSELDAVEHLLDQTLRAAGEPIDAMLRPLLRGGKRVRPVLVVLVGRLFARPAAPFHSLAAAVEMLHTATLIHDDVVDDAHLRRGRETLHETWPAGATVLAGDYLLARAVSLVAQLQPGRLVTILADTLCIVCAGEIGEALTGEGKNRDRDAYYRRVEAKAASLFAASTEMAGVLAGAREAQIAALRRYGRELGLAFQIADDVLDLTGTESRLGKPAGTDLRQGLITLPTLYYLDQVEDDTAVSTVLSRKRDDEHVQSAIRAICSSGAIEASLADARACARRSQEALALLPDNASRQALHALADFVVTRTH